MDETGIRVSIYFKFLARSFHLHFRILELVWSIGFRESEKAHI